MRRKVDPIRTWRKKPGFGPYLYKKDGELVEVKTGETLECSKMALGTYVERFDLADEDETVEEPSRYVSVPRKDESGFDVVDRETGRPVNEAPMTEDEAKEFLEKYEED